MSLRSIAVLFAFIACCFLPAQSQQSTPTASSARLGPARLYPPPFDHLPVAPSEPIRFILSEHGRAFATAHPNLRAFLKQKGMALPEVPAAQFAPISSLRTPQSSPAPAAMPCDAPTGARFNLEGVLGSPEIGFPVEQNEESIDFALQAGANGSELVIEGANDYRGFFDTIEDPNLTGGHPQPNAWGFGTTGYYVHTAGKDCSPTFEGAFPHLYYPPTQEDVYGFGDPVVAVDAARGRVYAADLRLGGTVTGIGLFRTDLARLNNPAACPNGTHHTDSSGDDTVPRRCWPISMLIDQVPQVGLATFSDKPHMRPDERASGTGAGDVYVSWTQFNIFQGTAVIQISVCPSNFARPTDCSAPITISGSDTYDQFSHLSVRPDGVVTLTYVSDRFIDNPNEPFSREVFDIKYVACLPQGAPRAPACSAPALVTTELQPLPFFGGSLTAAGLQANDYRVSTYPVHDQRWNGNRYEEFVVWARCKADPYVQEQSYYWVVCSDSDLAMTWSPTDSSDNALGWAPVSSFDVSPHDQVMPWLRTDHRQNVIHVAYLSSENDYFGHRLQTFAKQIDAEKYVPSRATVVTPVPTDPMADLFLSGFFIGDYIGVAARSDEDHGRAYFSFTGQYFEGLVKGVWVRGQDNELSGSTY